MNNYFYNSLNTNYGSAATANEFNSDTYFIDSEYVPLVKLIEAVQYKNVQFITNRTSVDSFNRSLLHSIFGRTPISNYINKIGTKLDGNNFSTSKRDILIYKYIKSLVLNNIELSEDYNKIYVKNIEIDYAELSILKGNAVRKPLNFLLLNTVFNSSRYMSYTLPSLVRDEYGIFNLIENNKLKPIGFLGVKADKVNIVLRCLKLGLPLKENWVKIVLTAELNAKDYENKGIRNSIRKVLKTENNNIVLEDNLFKKKEFPILKVKSIAEKNEMEKNFFDFVRATAARPENCIYFED